MGIDWERKKKTGERQNDDYTQNYMKGLLSVDYLFSMSEGGESKFKPYLGLNAGYIWYETGDTPNTLDADGFVLGGQAGVIFSVTENIDLDLMYRYSAGLNVTDDYSDTDRVDGIGSIVFGINYLY